MAKVVFKSVVKKYGEVVAVKDFNLNVEDKEFCILVGPSGCGKTTSLRMLAGLEDITSGEIYIGDRKVNDIPPKDRDIAMVFQNYALYPHMNVFENMSFGLRLRGYPKKDIDSRVNDAAEILSIGQLLDRKPKELSGGQRQRVAVGRAIVRKPKVFLFDEPLSNLDAKLRGQMRAELKKLHERLQTTIIYVTHDQVEAMTMGDRICVMKDGFIQQVDNPMHLYDNPKNKFVAGFIGSPPMNFIPVDVSVEKDEIWLDEGSFKVKIVQRMKQQIEQYAGKKMLLGIRPEDIYDKLFYRVGPLDGNVVPVTVDVVEPMGSEIYLHLNSGKNAMVAKVDPHNKSKTGQLIEVVFNMDKVHLFDTQTEVAVV